MFFPLTGADENGKAELVKPKVTRYQLPLLIVQLAPCPIGMGVGCFVSMGTPSN